MNWLQLDSYLFEIADIEEASVWLPRISASSQLIRNLGVASNSIVKVAKAWLMHS